MAKFHHASTECRLGRKYGVDPEVVYQLSKRLAFYKIELDDLVAMYSDQNGTCGICQEPRGLGLQIDHDHRTGRVRGFLCQPCNMSLGHIEKRLSDLDKIQNYLRGDRWSARSGSGATTT